MKHLLAIVTAIALSACAASGPEAPEAAETVAAANTGKVASSDAEKESTEEEIVCRMEQVTGSNFRREVCRAVADIEARREEDRNAMRQMRAIRSGSEDATNGIRASGGIGN